MRVKEVLKREGDRRSMCEISLKMEELFNELTHAPRKPVLSPVTPYTQASFELKLLQKYQLEQDRFDSK